ncbi:MAG TPA: acyl-CoA dehydrogenase family protein, partial [Bacteroidia bacterium]|nr:acyl-CoA dehydrogenase family protein [Bacteroidia bacterium]
MEFAATENQQMIAQTVKDFTEKHIRPNVMTWDEAQEFPLDVFKKMGDIGLMGILVPEQYQGAGLGYFEYVNAIVEVARVCGSVGLSMAAHNSLCTGHILAFGNEEQKKKWLPKLATGQWIGAWGLTEANTGSDAMRMQCVAKQDGDSWIINGAKNWITHGKSGDVAVVLARTGELLDSNGITAFVVERGTPGFKAGKKENKLGMRASETAELIF